PNPDFGAVFSYYLKEGFKTKKEIRQEKEKALKNRSVPFPGWEAVKDEALEEKAKIWLTVKDKGGNVVRRISGPTKKGFHRIAWDLRYPAPEIIGMNVSEGEEPKGMLAAPGDYTVELYKELAGKITSLAQPVAFTVVPLREGALKGASHEEVASFYRAYEKVAGDLSRVSSDLAKAKKIVAAMQRALARSQSVPGSLDERLFKLKTRINEIDLTLNGNPAKVRVGEKTKTTLGSRLFSVNRSISNSTYGPTGTNKKTMEIIKKELNTLSGKLDEAKLEIQAVRQALTAAGAPPVEK
ncbi:MAG: glycosyl hydrolase, partial [Bacteroidota bacterium]